MTKGTRADYLAHTGPQAPSRGLKVPDVDFGKGFGPPNDQLDRLRKLLEENPEIAAEIEEEGIDNRPRRVRRRADES